MPVRSTQSSHHCGRKGTSGKVLSIHLTEFALRTDKNNPKQQAFPDVLCSTVTAVLFHHFSHFDNKKSIFVLHCYLLFHSFHSTVCYFNESVHSVLGLSLQPSFLEEKVSICCFMLHCFYSQVITPLSNIWQANTYILSCGGRLTGAENMGVQIEFQACLLMS